MKYQTQNKRTPFKSRQCSKYRSKYRSPLPPRRNEYVILKMKAEIDKIFKKLDEVYLPKDMDEVYAIRIDPHPIHRFSKINRDGEKKYVVEREFGNRLRFFVNDYLEFMDRSDLYVTYYIDGDDKNKLVLEFKEKN